MSLRLVIERLRKLTGTYVPREEYLFVCTFLDGYNFALDGIPLRGFREWLALGQGRGANLVWYELARDAAQKKWLDSGHSVADDRSLIDAMLDLLSEFLDEIEERGVDRILARYEQRYGLR